MIQIGFESFQLESKVSSHPENQQSFILFIYYSHYKIWKILGCDTFCPPARMILNAEPFGEVIPIVSKLFFLSKNVEVEVGLGHVIYNICKYKLDYVHDN